MKTSESIVKITPAFLKAQTKIGVVIKTTENSFFHSTYADLSSVIDACKEELNKNDIAILQPIDGMTVETILVHTSGEWFSSSTPIVSKDANNPQSLGSAITYAKRYGLQSMVLLPAEDDDGNKASARPEKDPTDAWKKANEWDENRTKTASQVVSEDGGLSTSDHFCLIHRIEMKERTTKTGGHFYDHRQKFDVEMDKVNFDDPKGLWYTCDGKSDWKVSAIQ